MPIGQLFPFNPGPTSNPHKDNEKIDYSDEQIIELVRNRDSVALLLLLEDPKSRNRVLDIIKRESLDTREQLFLIVFKAPIELRLNVFSYWLYGESDMLSEAQSKSDAYYAKNLEQKLINLEDYGPFDYFSSGTPKQISRVPLSHQLNADYLVGVAFRGGLKASHMDLMTPSHAETFTHPLISRWYDSKMKEVKDTTELPFFLNKQKKEENSSVETFVCEYFAMNYPVIFKELKNGIVKLAAEFPEFYLCVSSSDEPSLNFRYAYKYHPELKQTDKAKMARMRANELVQYIMGLLKIDDPHFQRDTEFHKLIQDETSLPEVGVSMARKLESIFEVVLQSTRPAPTFYKPDFSLLIDQTTESIDKETLETNTFLSPDFSVDYIGSFIYNLRNPEQSDVPVSKIKGIILHTDFLTKEESDSILKRLILTLKVAYLKQPENVLPIYNNNGDLLWPFRE